MVYNDHVPRLPLHQYTCRKSTCSSPKSFPYLCVSMYTLTILSTGLMAIVFLYAENAPVLFLPISLSKTKDH